MTPYQTRVAEMAQSVEDLVAATGAATDEDLASLGYTATDLIEVLPDAKKLIKKRATKKIGKAA